jgi:hypothetical protein
MTLFSQAEILDVIHHHERSLEEAQKGYYAYFCEEAMRFFVPYVMERKEEILATLKTEAVRYPYMKTSSVVLMETNTYCSGIRGNSQTRRNMEEYLRGTGAWFECLSGLHRANIYTIFKNSDFPLEMNKVLGGGLYIGLQTKKVETVNGINVYAIRLSINLDLKH